MNSEKKLEIERKFLIHMPDMARLSAMPGCMRWEIAQTYLHTGPNGETRRIRRIFTDGREQLVYTEKMRVSGLSSDEAERDLAPSEYAELIRDADPERVAIDKIRFRIPYMDQLLEIDVYSFWKDRATLEIELESEDQPVCLPDWISVIRDVSDDYAYKNSMLARHVPMEPIE